MIEVMLINNDFKTKTASFVKGEVYWSNPKMKDVFTDVLHDFAVKHHKRRIENSVKFFQIDNIFQRAHKDGNFKSLIIVRFGGIGDLIALSSIIDYFEDCNIHFVTQERYFDVFDWFTKKPEIYAIKEPIVKDWSFSKSYTKYNTWACYHSEGLVENGHSQNWFELFFKFIGENNPDRDMMRPQLKTERINDNASNLTKYSYEMTFWPDKKIELLKNKPSLLICNKSTIMMRSMHAKDIYQNLLDTVKNSYDIFFYEFNLSTEDKEFFKDKQVNLIDKCDSKTFYLDLFDADMVISVDTGALHFREGINKPAIGLYNSFTTDSRTKYYEYTKSFDIKSECELQPCFIHERINIKFCPKGKNGMFAAPCLNPDSNKYLTEQLKDIFKENL